MLLGSFVNCHIGLFRSSIVQLDGSLETELAVDTYNFLRDV
jgi:hypothetical protein